LFHQVQAKLEERYRGLFHPLWTPSMIFLIGWYADQYFRFFDSGDLVNINHLRNICTIAAHLPDIRMWLPTREYETVRAVQEIPANLVVRVSAHLIDGSPPRGFSNTSTVVSKNTEAPATCPAPDQDGKCGECRMCWDSERKNVVYRLH
jgi:hypothetical protein